ncbi:PRC-barrel domain containing protein [Sphingomonas sp. 1P06PA]|uniref:PRC-barrel domain containing protein n=1 Tax=Sphingomonas sp. 1P06PA TaxID=554121 RepID=UPI0039A5BA77
MEDIAGWIAPAATMIAAMMTAANLGARVTGWGFVVFTVGSLAWIAVAVGSGQQNLLLANGFLTLVNIVGIWRWLGRQAKFADSAQAAEEESHCNEEPSRFAVSGLAGLVVKGRGGATIAHAVDALVACEAGKIGFLIVRAGGVGGVGETLHKLPWHDARMGDDAITTDLDAAALVRLPRAEA